MISSLHCLGSPLVSLVLENLDLHHAAGQDQPQHQTRRRTRKR